MADETPQTKGPSAIMALIKSGVIVGVLVVIEMVAAAMLIPSAHETERLAKQMARAARGEEAAATEEEDGPALQLEDTREVELLTDSITRFNPKTDATLNVQFAVYGIVLADELDEFNTQYEANMNRIKEQIHLTLHGTETANLTSDGLGLIKRQILEKTNRAIGRPIVREVIFSRINFVER